MLSLDELDKLAGELIMGWVYRENVEGVFGTGHYWDRDPVQKTEVFSYISWHPTRDISDAFMLLEKMNHAWQIKSLRFTNSYICCVMTIDINIFGEARTVPLAITLACLKARGVEVEK